MEMDKSDLNTEPLPESAKSEYIAALVKEVG